MPSTRQTAFEALRLAEALRTDAAATDELNARGRLLEESGYWLLRATVFAMLSIADAIAEAAHTRAEDGRRRRDGV